MVPKEAIIIGGGLSISNGLSLGLKEKIKNKFIITTNYAFKHFIGTFECFHDKSFYYPVNKDNPNIYEELKQLPLIIGINHNNIDKVKLPNTILLKRNEKEFKKNSLVDGFYTGNLSGIFALTLASFLLDYNGKIFLLGYDWTKNNPNAITHYYTDVKHRGVGKTNWYNSHNPHNYFKYFNFSNLKIYNVSLESTIEDFEKISYEKMFELLSNEIINQEELRTQIRSKLCTL